MLVRHHAIEYCILQIIHLIRHVLYLFLHLSFQACKFLNLLNEVLGILLIVDCFLVCTTMLLFFKLLRETGWVLHPLDLLLPQYILQVRFKVLDW